jgi:2-amino-4-hydroxy-6-hydroxymethyldihydropteridine diphosphokinase
MEEKIVLLLGSNMGDTKENLERAVLELTAEFGESLAESAIYKTEPWGIKDQNIYLNQVVIFESLLRPERVLEVILSIEKRMGRKKILKWGPRLIDIDILFFGDLIYESTDLKIPHPFISERRFALVPLCELLPQMEHPLLRKKLLKLLETCQDNSLVEKL